MRSALRSTPLLRYLTVRRSQVALFTLSPRSHLLALPSSSPFSSIRTMSSPSAPPPNLTPFFIDDKSSVAAGFLPFVNSSPSQFHAVATAASMLLEGGFTRVKETDDWTATLSPGGAYFYTRNQSSLIAFILPSTFRSTPSTKAPATSTSSTTTSSSSPPPPFLILAAHTDSPVLKVKPVSAVTKLGCLQVGVECYGGGLWHTWFDRDLSVAGRLVVKGDDGGYTTRLVRIDQPILRIPNLAIHLNREVNEKGFLFNKQTHLLPVLATVARTQLNAPATSTPSPTSSSTSSSTTSSPISTFHHSTLLQLLSTAVDVPVSSIIDLELSLFDTQPAVLGGPLNEFIHSRALDNLMMSYISLRALLAHKASSTSSPSICCVALFDNEEVGSESYQGAGASLVNFLQRVTADPSAYDAVMRRSLLVSADMAHGVHPNYGEAHEEHHRPMLHHGLVVKQNANQRYATSMLTAFHLKRIGEKYSIPIQQFVVRNDSACGSTIGPILSANTGIRVVDVGVPQWSMHSIRETCGVADVESAFQLFVNTFKDFSQLDEQLVVEGE